MGTDKEFNIVNGKTVRIFIKSGKALERDIIRRLCKRINMSKRDAESSIDVAIKEKEIRRYGNYLIRI